MFTNTPSDKVQLVGLGELLSPAKCMICGNGTCDEGYARLGVWYDYEGEQYICRTCVVQIAELFKCLTPEEAQHLQEQATDYAALNEAYHKELTDARERLAVFSGMFSDFAASNPDANPHAVPLVTTAGETVPTPDGVDEQTTGESDANESESSESVTGNNSAGVSGTTVQHSEAGTRVIPRL